MKKDLLGLKDLPAETISAILDRSFYFKRELEGKKRQELYPNKLLFTLFYENSTRTKLSFQSASQFLGLITRDIAVATSSVQKGESLVDTGRTLDALYADVVVMRNSLSGSPHLLSKSIRASVINAGDGMNEHPTQALLDLMTAKEAFGHLNGLNVLIAGDIKHSRVARSNIYGLKKLGASVTLLAPPTLMPAGIESLGVKVSYKMDEAIAGADVVMPLRIQQERQEKGLLPSLGEFRMLYGFDEKCMAKANKGAILLHPGPVNIGVELDFYLKYSKRSYIDTQVTNGVAVRMAVIDWLLSK